MFLFWVLDVQSLQPFLLCDILEIENLKKSELKAVGASPQGLVPRSWTPGFLTPPWLCDDGYERVATRSVLRAFTTRRWHRRTARAEHLQLITALLSAGRGD